MLLWEEDRNLNRVLDPGEVLAPERMLPGGIRFDCTGVMGPPYAPTQPPPGPVTFPGSQLNAPDGRWASPGAVYLANDWGDHAAVSVAMSGRPGLVVERGPAAVGGNAGALCGAGGGEALSGGRSAGTRTSGRRARMARPPTWRR